MSGVEDRFSPLVRELHARAMVNDLDLHLVARLAGGLLGPDAALPGPVQLALVLAGRAIRDSHVCLDLDALGPDAPDPWPTPEERARLSPAAAASFRESGAWLADAARRSEGLRAPAPLVGPPEPDGESPFVLDGSRLYLRRYWAYEHEVAERLWERARDSSSEKPETAGLDEDLAATLKEEQQHAARMAMSRRLCVISGGPGTGKTYTAARILALLSLRARQENRPLRIRVAAPTGKAAGRVHESLAAAAESGRVKDVLNDLEPASTLDRLLGYRHHAPYYRHDAGNPLPADVVLVDEASMIDLPKMAKLLDALRPDTRLILLGDRHQLASVQPGSVLGEMCQSPALRECVVELTDSARFGITSPLGRLSAAVKGANTEAEARAAWDRLARPPTAGDSPGAPVRHASPDALTDKRGTIHPGFAEQVLTGYRPLLEAVTPEAAFAALSAFRVLCVLRHGPFGSVPVNRLIENVLALNHVDRNALDPDLIPGTPLDPGTPMYGHRVLMVLRNDYGLNLFNGDIGIVLPDAEDGGRLAVFFEKHGPSASTASRFRRLSHRLLPEHETAFAMTVHKSQGSEFERALLLLPKQENPVLTRETVYTGLTRVRDRIDVWADEAVFTSAVRRTVRRFSGLGIRLASAAARARVPSPVVKLPIVPFR